MESMTGLFNDDTPDSVMTLQTIRQYIAANMAKPASLQSVMAPAQLPPSAAQSKPAAEVTASEATDGPPAVARADASAATLMPD